MKPTYYPRRVCREKPLWRERITCKAPLRELIPGRSCANLPSNENHFRALFCHAGALDKSAELWHCSSFFPWNGCHDNYEHFSVGTICGRWQVVDVPPRADGQNKP